MSPETKADMSRRCPETLHLPAEPPYHNLRCNRSPAHAGQHTVQTTVPTERVPESHTGWRKPSLAAVTLSWSTTN